MDIWSRNKLILFIAFVVPGFIAMKAYELLSPSKQTNSSKLLVDAISYSCINYGILFWPIFVVESSNLKKTNFNLYLLFYMGVLFIAPLLIAVAWKYLRQLDWLQKFIPHPTQRPWDYVFAKRNMYWVIVTLRNGDKIAGMYGPNSFASSSPSDEEIYLEEQWILNEEGGFERKAMQSSGIIILSSEIRSVEFMHSGEKHHEQ